MKRTAHSQDYSTPAFRVSIAFIAAAALMMLPAIAEAQTTYGNNDTMNVSNDNADAKPNNFVNGNGSGGPITTVVRDNSHTGSSDTSGNYQRLPVTVNSTDRDSTMTNNWQQ